MDREYAKMESEQNRSFERLHYISTIADIWSVHNKSFLGITVHWIDPVILQRQKAALACKRVKGRHTYNVLCPNHNWLLCYLTQFFQLVLQFLVFLSFSCSFFLMMLLLWMAKSTATAVL